MSATRLVPIDNWCIEYQWATQAWERLEASDITAFGWDDSGPITEMQYSVTDGIAVLNLEGPLTKDLYCGGMFGGTSTVLARRALQKASRDPNVNSILLRIYSPGGQVSGTGELASEIAKITKSGKRCVAYAEDLCASAAYWIASQCESIYCNPTAAVGSIGTYMVMYDTSKAYEERGIKVHVIGSGDFKGAGESGTKITEKMLSRWRTNINDVNSHFTNAVAAGRKLTPESVAELATGETWIGAKAKDVGLVDDVRSFDDVLADMRNGKLKSKGNGKSMANEGLLERLRAALSDEPSASVETSEIALLRELRAIGVTSVTQLSTMHANSRIGLQHIADRRAYATSQAIRLYGTEAGVKAASRIEFASLDEVNASITAWESQADKLHGTSARNAGTRVSASATPLNAESDVEEAKATSIEEALKMTPLGQRALSGRK